MSNFTPLSVLELAQVLADTDESDPGMDEAIKRAAIGRFYYACFLDALASLSESGKGWHTVSTGRDDHRLLPQAMREHKAFDPADDLEELKRLRQHADYHWLKPIVGCNLCPIDGNTPIFSDGYVEDAKYLAGELSPFLDRQRTWA